ncbi:MAG: C4-type zinc ribbon domain-containing protein [Bacteroidia bacterium]|jgi:predicted  nucleic acid-binding Zn-ribbon protein
MAKATKTVAEKLEVTIEERLKALFQLQQIDAAIDKIKTIRGELPLEVKDLEDEIEGLTTRVGKIKAELDEMEVSTSDKNNIKREALEAIKRNEAQQDNVRNNREFDAISKEIEYQKLEIELADKKIKEYKFLIAQKTEIYETANVMLTERSNDLVAKQKELHEIISETEKDEKALAVKSNAAQEHIEPRLLSAYKRIKSNAHNGLAVVPINRDSCGGCFNKIPPQTQVDIAMHKKIIVCEYCGRILVDEAVLLQEITE